MKMESAVVTMGMLSMTVTMTMSVTMAMLIATLKMLSVVMVMAVMMLRSILTITIAVTTAMLTAMRMAMLTPMLHIAADLVAVRLSSMGAVDMQSTPTWCRGAGCAAGIRPYTSSVTRK